MLDYLGGSLEAHKDATMTFVRQEKTYSYAETKEKALEVARGLQALKLDLTHPIGLIFDNSDEFLFSFLGCQIAGGIPSPFAPPANANALEAYFQQMYRIMQNAGSRYLIIETKFKDFVENIVKQLYPDITVFSYSEIAAAGAATEAFSSTQRSDNLVLVQYTSGSTSDPRGVRVTNNNLASALDAISSGIQLNHTDVNGQWLPMHHDMGLIGMLAGLSKGVDHYIWTPVYFIRNPGKWLAGFAEHRASIYAGPNFSYDILSKYVDDEAIAKLDLSNWRVAFNGAEPIDYRLIRRFTEKLQPAGFKPKTIFPVYGLAEATLPVSFPALGSLPKAIYVDHDQLISEGVARELSPSAQQNNVTCLVSVGRAVKDHKIRIFNEKGDVSGQARVGEIQVSGPAIMSGYYNNQEASDDSFSDGWLKTGDTGFILQDNLYIVGRMKEMVIIRGQNYYPHDIEWLIKDTPGIYHGRAICFSLLRENEEVVGIIVESKLSDSEEQAALIDRIRSRVLEQFNITAVEVHIMPPKSIKRTTSGKFKRGEMKRMIQDLNHDTDKVGAA